MNKCFIIVFFLLALSFQAFAKTYEVKMLNIGENGSTMVFEPGFLHIESGDSVTFVPASKGHWAKSLIVPDGVSQFEGKINEAMSVTFEKEGIYVYVCPPHQVMNMSGIIQVGRALNLNQAKEALPAIEHRAVTNKGRLNEYAKKIQE
ncbi:plastocyanin/azurin family copper-binding protein [Campylobacter sp. MIT 21-1685]|uniref:plastocyanin/azurin family copper-binding protein n=1 Tax=unclassified Campylobacter TaxID=2593542 RepID=UPI00224B394D|nr:MULTISPECIES: plastocyanin/azurin family copper-binding protein [unclassified Campylobacter]MCX2683087.1 plastocyanin/azurin family copper-binding protein [Campylobacter sp. MIT 21-1684]MCX2751369.1 plastocyanin/azurin family copper-binding protein [Campylobacter sp. MIT 21-1682]MCX2807568.1 plastocyanin/azurin family copper-binding protein [Campylobacter sp. MIT 21-1685]